jgi:diamine N-acetyltransferase
VFCALSRKNDRNVNPTLEIATPADAAELVVLARTTYVAAFGDDFTPANLAAHLERHLSLAQIRHWLHEDTVIVARDGGSIIGYCQVGKTDEADAKTFEIRRLYVLAAYHNRGVGTLLLRAALDRPELQQARRVLIDVWDQNAGARRLYERFGFKTAGRKEFRVESGEVTGFDLVMELIPPGTDLG